MKTVKKVLKHNKAEVFVIVVNLLVIVFILANLSKLPPTVPLFYGNVEGKEQLSPVTGLLIPPGFVLIVAVMNALIAKLTEDSFIHTFLAASAVVFTVLSTITVLKIMLLVGNF